MSADRTPAVNIDENDPDGFWGHLRGTLIRWDVPSEECNLWMQVIVRALADGDQEGEDRASRWEFLHKESDRPFGLRWIADHLSNDPDGFVRYFRRADRQAWRLARKFR